MLKGNAIVAQSGGPTAVINSSVCGVAQQWLKNEQIGTLYGALFGIRGVLEGRLVDLGAQSQEVIAGLRYTPGAALGSSRYKLKTEEDYIKLLEAFKKYNIRYFFYIGGNDSMDTCDKVNRLAEKNNYEMRVIGIPKTVDNDLPVTDHCPGYGSAARYIATSVLEAGMDLKNLITGNRIVLFEAMGRNTGWLAAASVLARREPGDAPHLIYLPEVPFNKDRFLADVEAVYRKNDYAFVVVSEGLVDEKGDYIFAGKERDSFGHAQLGGLADTLRGMIEAETGVKVRTIIPATLQRSAMHCVSGNDNEEAYRLGVEAVNMALQGQSGIMLTLVREEGTPYRCSIGSTELAKVANVEKKVPREWITREGNDVTADFINYARPLIEGELSLPMKGGLPLFSSLEGVSFQELRVALR
ncbi:MAG TPA: 6-phosphofructokinase [Bacillota bacterium]|jgi:6-phosphofructokinase 1|nr:6-phosphofructokinase [Bacillota bacterium]HOB86700.1 6-phosphofructokinase [Bacillota bacterium]HOP69380.1 6-phosphofructokinase [Bacillota bacterium]HPT33213.1 6-phosphofructokinase [Bacillota bacterium]HPZ65096.1 6-phosphofructokinase [Bacillota bacterium]